MRGDDCGAESVKVVLPHLLRLLRVELAVAIEEAQKFAFFRRDAYQRGEGSEVLSFQLGDVFWDRSRARQRCTRRRHARVWRLPRPHSAAGPSRAASDTWS